MLLGVAAACAAAVLSEEEEAKMVRISTPEVRSAFLGKMMKEALGLSAEECSRVESVNLKYERHLQELLTDNTADRKEREMVALDRQRERELKKTLASKQYKDYKRVRNDLRMALRNQLHEQKDMLDREAYAELSKMFQREKVRTDSTASAKPRGQEAK